MHIQPLDGRERRQSTLSVDDAPAEVDDEGSDRRVVANADAGPEREPTDGEIARVIQELPTVDEDTEIEIAKDADAQLAPRVHEEVATE